MKMKELLEIIYGDEIAARLSMSGNEDYFTIVAFNETVQSCLLALIFAALIIPRLAVPILGGLRWSRSLLRRGKENAGKAAKETETRQPPNIHQQLADLRLLLKHGYLDRAEINFSKKVLEKDANQLTDKETARLAKISNRYSTCLESLRQTS